MSWFDRFRKKERGAPKIPQQGMEKTEQVKEEKKKLAQKAVEKPAPSMPAVDRTRNAAIEGYRQLIRPLVTEKGTMQQANGMYSFVVSPDANKIQIANAIRAIYGVTPISVNVMNMSGKWIRYGRHIGRRKHWRKANVTLKEGESINVFQGVS